MVLILKLVFAPWEMGRGSATGALIGELEELILLGSDMDLGSATGAFIGTLEEERIVGIILATSKSLQTHTDCCLLAAQDRMSRNHG